MGLSLRGTPCARVSCVAAALLGWCFGTSLAAEDVGVIADAPEAKRADDRALRSVLSANGETQVLTAIAQAPARATRLYLEPGGQPIAHLDTGVPLVVTESAASGAWLKVEAGRELVVRGWLPRENLGGYVLSPGKLGDSPLWAAAGDVVQLVPSDSAQHAAEVAASPRSGGGQAADTVDVVARTRIPVYQAPDQPAHAYWELAASATLPKTRLGQPAARDSAQPELGSSAIPTSHSPYAAPPSSQTLLSQSGGAGGPSPTRPASKCLIMPLAAFELRAQPRAQSAALPLAVPGPREGHFVWAEVVSSQGAWHAVRLGGGWSSPGPYLVGFVEREAPLFQACPDTRPEAVASAALASEAAVPSRLALDLHLPLVRVEAGTPLNIAGEVRAHAAVTLYARRVRSSNFASTANHDAELYIASREGIALRALAPLSSLRRSDR